MKYILFSILYATGIFTSIYSIPVTSVNNETIDLNVYQGKKILFVNIATASSRVDQLEKLQDLYEEYSDSLVVIAFPSNSFDNEPLANAGIRQFCSDNYNVTFPIASKSEVKGANIHALYEWLTTELGNGVGDSEVKGDFQKFIINGQGELIGVFAGSVSPDHPGIIQAITQN